MNELINDVINCKRVQDMAKLRKEVFVVLYLVNGKFKGNADYDSIGSIDHVSIPDPDVIIKNCHMLNCKSILLIHNHPYHRGIETFFMREYYNEPSITDIASTRIFSEIVSEHGISILDHIIVTQNGYFSFVENRLM